MSGKTCNCTRGTEGREFQIEKQARGFGEIIEVKNQDLHQNEQILHLFFRYQWKDREPTTRPNVSSRNTELAFPP